MNTFKNNSVDRQAAINSLAVVGFVALIIGGIWLAVYSTRYVPTVVGQIGAAAVYLGSVFTPSEDTSLSVVPSDTLTTIPFGDISSTAVTNASSTSTTTSTSATPVATTAGTETTTTKQISGPNTPATLTGLPDLSVLITGIGYLSTTSASSFVASSTVPNGSRPAVRFTVKNTGTNMSGAWRFSASIPTTNSYLYQSPTQQTLAPGDSIDYTLGFDQATSGAGKLITITVDFESVIPESNEANNTISAAVTVLGS